MRTERENNALPRRSVPMVAFPRPLSVRRKLEKRADFSPISFAFINGAIYKNGRKMNATR